MSGVMKRRVPSPPALTIGLLVAIGVGVWLVGFAARTGSSDSARFVASTEWTTWTIAAGLSVAVFVTMLVLGLAAIVRPPHDWGLDSAPDRRRIGYLVVALLLVAALAGILVFGGAPSRPVASLPVEHIIWRTRGVLVTGFLAMVPWLALVWLAHAECFQVKSTLQQLSPWPVSPTDHADDGVDGRPGDAGVEPIRQTIEQLQRLWRLMTRCVGAAATTIVVAIVTSGALRTAFLAYAPRRSAEFPASTVLLFGLLFALLQAAIGLPLITSWRARARSLVDVVYPVRFGVRAADGWLSDRQQLEQLLHLDVPLLRNPLTALSLFAPLLTSVLAVFIPQLTSG
jgi:hypothetical protein